MNDLLIDSPVVEQATSTGLVIREGATVEQLDNVLSQIDIVERNAQELIKTSVNWARSDVWNALEHANGAEVESTRVDLAKAHKLTYMTMSNYAKVAREFDFTHRCVKLSFTHHLILASQGTLTTAQRVELLRLAEAEGWSVSKTRREGLALLGRKPKTQGRPAGPTGKLPMIAEAVADSLADVADLPKSVKGKVERRIKRMYSEIEKGQMVVIEQEVKARVAEVKKELLELRQKAKKDLELAKHLSEGATAFMTRDEYRLIRSCLHTDRKVSKDRLDKAMVIINRVGEKAGW